VGRKGIIENCWRADAKKRTKMLASKCRFGVTKRGRANKWPKQRSIIQKKDAPSEDRAS